VIEEILIISLNCAEVAIVQTA